MLEKTMTSYQYTYQNPIKYTDPTGMSAEDGGYPPLKLKLFLERIPQMAYNNDIKQNGGKLIKEVNYGEIEKQI